MASYVRELFLFKENKTLRSTVEEKQQLIERHEKTILELQAEIARLKRQNLLLVANLLLIQHRNRELEWKRR